MRRTMIKRGGRKGVSRIEGRLAPESRVNIQYITVSHGAPISHYVNSAFTF